MHKSQIFFWLCLCFLIGVALVSVFSLPLIVVTAGVAVSTAGIVLGWPPIGEPRPSGGPRFKIIFIGFCLLAVCLGIWRYQANQTSISSQNIQFFAGQTVSFKGLVGREVEIENSYQSVTVRAQQIYKPEKKIIKGRVLVNAKRFPEIKYGDVLIISCQLEKPTPLGDFAYDRYLSLSAIYAMCRSSDVIITAHEQGNSLLTLIYKIKWRFLTSVNNLIPEPEAALLAGLLVGARQSIPDEIVESFNRTGTTHIIALSGFNITILAAFVLALAKHLYLSRRLAFLFTALTIGIFVVMTGASASVTRAAIMGLLVLLARELGRPAAAINTLVLAAVTMVALNPLVLMFDVGFQLSFLSTLGLILLSPKIAERLARIRDFLGAKEAFTMTLAATLSTLPVVVINFHRFSVVAPLVNILIVPFVPLTMAIGFVIGVTGLILPAFTLTFAWLAWLPLTYIIHTVTFFSHLPFASFTTQAITTVVVLLGYALLAFWWHRRRLIKALKIITQ